MTLPKTKPKPKTMPMTRPWLVVTVQPWRPPRRLWAALSAVRRAARSDQLPLVVLDGGAERVVLVRLADFVDWFGAVPAVPAVPAVGGVGGVGGADGTVASGPQAHDG